MAEFSARVEEQLQPDTTLKWSGLQPTTLRGSGLDTILGPDDWSDFIFEAGGRLRFDGVRQPRSRVAIGSKCLGPMNSPLALIPHVSKRAAKGARPSSRTDDELVAVHAPEFTSVLKTVQVRQHSRVMVRIADSLGVAIVAGEYLPGTLLPRELDSSEIFHVSRSAYREAIKTLSAKGLVESRPKVGTRVAPRPRWHFLDPDVLRWSFAGNPTEEFVRHLFELRTILEPHAAELAAKRRTSEQLERMRLALQQLCQFGVAHEEGRIADQQFHQEIFLATRNQVLTTFTHPIGAVVRWSSLFRLRVNSPIRDPLPRREQLLAFIRSKNSTRAGQCARELVDDAFNEIREAMRTQRPR